MFEILHAGSFPVVCVSAYEVYDYHISTQLLANKEKIAKLVSYLQHLKVLACCGGDEIMTFEMFV